MTYVPKTGEEARQTIHDQATAIVKRSRDKLARESAQDILDAIGFLRQDESPATRLDRADRERLGVMARDYAQSMAGELPDLGVEFFALAARIDPWHDRDGNLVPEHRPRVGHRMVAVTFRPQSWQNDYAIPAEPEGETFFLVPAEDVRGIDPCSDDADEALKQHPNAPSWIQDWRGPYEFEWATDAKGQAKTIKFETAKKSP